MHVRVKTCVCKCTGHCVDKFVCEGFLDHHHQHHHLHISPSLSPPTSHHGFCRMFLEGTLRAFDLSLARICGVCLQVCFGATASSSSFLILFVFLFLLLLSLFWLWWTWDLRACSHLLLAEVGRYIHIISHSVSCFEAALSQSVYVWGPISQLPYQLQLPWHPRVSEVAHLSGAQRGSAATCVVVARRLGLPRLDVWGFPSGVSRNSFILFKIYNMKPKIL